MYTKKYFKIVFSIIWPPTCSSNSNNNCPQIVYDYDLTGKTVPIDIILHLYNTYVLL